MKTKQVLEWIQAISFFLTAVVLWTTVIVRGF